MPTGITPFVCLPRGNSQGRLFGDSLYASGTLNNETQFGGKANVPGLEAYDFFARYYDPQLGRFYGLDPVNNPAASPYAYCYNNPLRYVDPTGMLPKVYDDQWSKFVNKWNAGKINSAHIYWPDAGIDIYLTKGDNLNLILAFLVSSDPTKQLPALDERGGGGWVQKHIENTLKAYQGAGPTTNPWQEVMENRGVPAGPVKSGDNEPTGFIKHGLTAGIHLYVAGEGGASFALGFLLCFDTKGNIALMETGAFGMGALAELTANAGVQVTNAYSVMTLANEVGSDIGATIAFKNIGLSGSWLSGPSYNGGELDWSSGIGLEGHTQWTFTKVKVKINIKDIFKR